MNDNSSETAPHGALTPPQLQQTTAIAASAPRSPVRPGGNRMPLRETLRGLVEEVFDRLDAAADRIADAAGLR